MPLTCISWCFAITGAHRQERKMNYFNAENWEGTAAEIETANEAFEIVLAHLMKIDGEDFDEEFMFILSRPEAVRRAMFSFLGAQHPPGRDWCVGWTASA
jgi:hypothetical protein